jgi:hypothetical protein
MLDPHAWGWSQWSMAIILFSTVAGAIVHSAKRTWPPSFKGPLIIAALGVLTLHLLGFWTPS